MPRLLASLAPAALASFVLPNGNSRSAVPQRRRGGHEREAHFADLRGHIHATPSRRKPLARITFHLHAHADDLTPTDLNECACLAVCSGRDGLHTCADFRA